MALLRARPPAADELPADPAPGLAPAPALDDADPQRRRQALHALAGRADALPALLQRLALEQDPQVRIVLVNALVDTQCEAAAQALARELASEDVALRNLAITALSEMPDAALAVLPAVLQADDPDQRIFAATVAGAIGGPQACELLVGLLMREREVNVVDAAVNALAEIGGREHLPVLRDVRRRFDAHPYIVFAAGAAIAALERAALAG